MSRARRARPRRIARVTCNACSPSVSDRRLQASRRRRHRLPPPSCRCRRPLLLRHRLPRRPLPRPPPRLRRPLPRPHHRLRRPLPRRLQPRPHGPLPRFRLRRRLHRRPPKRRRRRPASPGSTAVRMRLRPCLLRVRRSRQTQRRSSPTRAAGPPWSSPETHGRRPYSRRCRAFVSGHMAADRRP